MSVFRLFSLTGIICLLILFRFVSGNKYGDSNGCVLGNFVTSFLRFARHLSIRNACSCRRTKLMHTEHLPTITTCRRTFHEMNSSGNRRRLQLSFSRNINLPLIGTLKPQSNGPLYRNMVIGALTVDGWAVTFGTARSAWAGCGPDRIYTKRTTS